MANASSEHRPELPSEFSTPARDVAPPPVTVPTPSSDSRHRVPMPDIPTTVALVTDSVITRPLAERMASGDPQVPIGVVIEVRTDSGLAAEESREQLIGAIKLVAGDVAIWTTSSYVMTALTVSQILALVDNDSRSEASAPRSRQDQRTAPRRHISRIWPNFEVQATIHRSVMTVKADAAVRSFEASGSGIVWAVLDTGVDAKHEHFAAYDTFRLPGSIAHRSFVTDSPDPLTDANGHGTHVAGIIAGGRVATARKPIVAATWYRTAEGDAGVEEVHLERITGMAPETKILSCTVLRPDRTGDVAALLTALEYIQELNQGGRVLNVHGVNLSLGYPFDPSWFATGQSPVCREVDRLVANGVCVVVSAGNTGFGAARDTVGREMRIGFDMTINDPGNAARAITVGSTSIKPYSSGVSYFSSKGPTGDGRLKPDLVAPGERIVSAGCGQMLEKARQSVEKATYVEDSGTSMSAPHVSGVAAAFLSVHREFIGRPDDVKRILMDSAGDLGRQRTFQGSGLVDAMRAIQSV